MPAMLLALAVAAAPAAGPAASPEVRADVAALLGVIDRPVSPESFRRFGSEGEAALADIALSRDLPPRRARALEVLAALGSARAEGVHRSVAASTDAPTTVRRAAIFGLGRLLSQERAATALRPFLERDRDPRVRAAAGEALSAYGAACGAVRAQAAKEGEMGRARFARALAACDRQKPR